MGNPVRTFIAMLVVTAVAAILAGWTGVRYGLRESGERRDLDLAIHRDLHLSDEQDRQMHALEDEFSTVRAHLQKEMRAANRDLARAIVQDHAYGPRARQAVEHFHAAMGTLQERTIQHVLAIRALLTPAQARDFDEKVTKALGFVPP